MEAKHCNIRLRHTRLFIGSADFLCEHHSAGIQKHLFFPGSGIRMRRFQMQGFGSGRGTGAVLHKRRCRTEIYIRITVHADEQIIEAVVVCVTDGNRRDRTERIGVDCLLIPRLVIKRCADCVRIISAEIHLDLCFAAGVLRIKDNDLIRCIVVEVARLNIERSGRIQNIRLDRLTRLRYFSTQLSCRIIPAKLLCDDLGIRIRRVIHTEIQSFVHRVEPEHRILRLLAVGTGIKETGSSPVRSRHILQCSRNLARLTFGRHLCEVFAVPAQIAFLSLRCVEGLLIFIILLLLLVGNKDVAVGFASFTPEAVDLFVRCCINTNGRRSVIDVCITL